MMHFALVLNFRGSDAGRDRSQPTWPATEFAGRKATSTPTAGKLGGV